MLKNSAHLLGAAALAALLTGPAAAWQDGGSTDRSVVELEQVQLNDVWSNMTVEVPHVAPDAVSNSTAVGNAAAGLVTRGDIDLDVYQTLQGNVGAENRLIGGAIGTGITTTTAYGNSSTGGTWSGASYYRAEQQSSGTVSADTTIDVAGANQMATATTAIANVSVPTGENGGNYAFQQQASNGSVRSSTDVDMCCTGTSGTFATTAGGNALSSTGSTTTAINGAVQTTAQGQRIAGATDVYMGNGTNVLAATSVFGNSANLQNEWGYATLGRDGSEVFQGNDSDIDSQTYVTLDHWNGYANSSAYGVGNSALVSNVGSDTGLYANQNNYGTIYTQAGLSGDSFTGGTGVVSATSIGNAATASLCTTCGDAVLQGRTNQFNAGQVIARGQASTSASGGVYGSATAVGNSATYQASGH